MKQIVNLGKIVGGQDGAVSNGFLFRFDGRGICHVYDMNTCLSDASSEHAAFARFTLDKADIIMPHSNSVMFGREYYSPDDEFPLLYTNIYNSYASSHDQMRGTTCVYRILKNGSDFSSKLVQLIEIGFAGESLWQSENAKDIRPYGNFVIDREKGLYYAFTMRDESRTTRYFAFDLPKVCDGTYDKNLDAKRVPLNTNDIKTWFDCEYHRYLQGACCHDGLIYSLEGFTEDAVNPPALRIIDPENRTQKIKYLFADFGMTIEPEMIDFEGDTCYYSDNHGNLYRLDF
ncbi:MAG: hypothetical protein IIW34_06500 [Clostridia bacterium]|nr:hypothetical protein [Clostridia bacterium]